MAYLVFSTLLIALSLAIIIYYSIGTSDDGPKEEDPTSPYMLELRDRTSGIFGERFPWERTL